MVNYPGMLCVLGNTLIDNTYKKKSYDKNDNCSLTLQKITSVKEST